ncbi:MAG: hypothetical protein HOQ29_11980, partial [Acidobacteria bacterium]|nr:hypothetical protein [Acidobacteriota bacterium]
MRLRRLSRWVVLCSFVTFVCCASAAPAGPAAVIGGERPGAPADAAVAPAQEIRLPNKPDS